MAEYQYNLGIKFYAVAEAYSEGTALHYPDGARVSYKELNLLSNQVARYLLSKGIKQGDVIAIFNEKSLFAFALILGCLKIGAIYTNLDVSSPWIRISKIINTCEPEMVFMDQLENPFGEFKEYFPKLQAISLKEKDTQAEIFSKGQNNLDITGIIHGGHPAYIMFTSGSTGFPKGALISHDNVLNFIEWGKQTFRVTKEDVFTNANPIYFDNSVFDFYISIFNGASLVPLSHELVKNAKQLVNAINDSNCTIWFSVPSLLVYLLTTRTLRREDFQSIKRISFGGEGFPKSKLKQLFDLFGDRISLYNVYGPTECTCICSSHIITAKDFDNMNELATLGFIAPNFSYEILPIDDDKQDVGELALIGPCVGLGYYNDDERTQKSFVRNPRKKFEQRMYKTGDLIEKAQNGYLYFKGRIDNQIKHMGYRVELEEIEAAFNSLSYIDEVGVIYEKLSSELSQIKAFISVSQKGKGPEEILLDIKRLLPPYMVPRVIQVMEKLPKNANGKIDRKQLTQIKV